MIWRSGNIIGNLVPRQSPCLEHSLSSLGLLHRLASKNLNLFWAHIELPQPHSRLSFNTFIRPSLPELLYCYFIKVSTPVPDLKTPINHQGIYLITHRQFLLKLPTHAQHLPLHIQDPLNTESDASCSAHRQSLVLPHPIPVTGELIIGRYGIMGDFSRKIASMSDYKDSLLKYHGLSFTLFVNFVRFHLLG